jgi:glycosyltransferase involved in cell wall biosynthesis
VTTTMANNELPLVSIVIPCRNERGYIERCLDSIRASDYPQERMEILVADGRSSDGTRGILVRYCARHPSVVLLDNPQGTTPAGLNTAISAATGQVVIRMDAHVLYPPDYVRRLVAGLQESGADNVGGVLETVAGEDTPVARAIALAMSHRFGVGNSHHRVGTSQQMEVDTVPFGCFRKEVFDRVGMFDEELVRNQDDEFNFRLITRGGRVVLLPDVSCRYFSRRTLGQLARMYYQYGYFKPLVARKVGRVMTVRQLVPAMFVLALAGAAWLSLWLPGARLGLAGLLATYGSLVLLCAGAALPRHGWRCAAALAAVFPLLHMSYGVGFLLGIKDHVLVPTAPRRSALGLSR